MKNQPDTSLRIRLAGMAILGLFIALAAAAYFSGQQVKRDSELVVTDAVPGTIAAHKMRMDMSRSIGWVMVAASAPTAQSRDASLKIVHDADVAFTNDVKQYETTMLINPAEDQALLAAVTRRYATFQQRRLAYESLILAGDRDGSAAFLERDLVPAYTPVIASAEKLLDYNHANSIAYANHIRNSVHRLYWTVAVVMALALLCAAVLAANFAIRRRELKELRESEAALKEAQRLAQIGSSIWDARIDKTTWSDELYRIVGWDPARHPPTHEERKKIYTPESFAILDRAVKQALATGEPWDLQLEIVRPDGEHRQVNARGSGVRDENGIITGLHGTLQDITERKRATEQLEMLKVSIDKHFDGAYWMDANNQFVYVNDTACKALGYAREELLGKPVTMIAPNATPHLLEEVWKRLRETGFFTRESVHRRKDGSQFPVELVASYVRFGDKEFNCSFTRDISERRQAEEALRQSEDKYRKIFENVQDVFYQTDNHGTLVEISPSIERYSGYRREEVIGKPVEEVYHNKEDRDSLLRILREKGEVVDYELRLKTKSGRLVYASANSHVLFDSGGKPVGIEGSLRDITERKRAQEELVSKTALLEAQVDSTLDGILVVDTEGRRILQNQRFFELFKVPEEVARDANHSQVLQHAVNQMKHPRQFSERVAHLYANQDEIGRDEIELMDGRIIDRYSAPVRDKAGKHYGRIWTFRDITGQRKLEEQFRQSQKMEAVGQLASGVAHDFNNILAVIQLQSELLRTEGNLSPTQQGFASEIGESTKRAAALTRQLLLFSRKEKMMTRELDLDKSISDMTKMLRRTLGADVELQFKFSIQPLFVRADAGMMDQVLMNLAVNARDAMPKGGKLVVETFAVELDDLSVATTPLSRPGAFVCLSVSDTGCGIPPEIMPKIFEPFFTTKDVGKGTGLGLATVFGIVQQHQGWINVYSEVGRGTTFRIYLPRLARISDQKFVTPTAEPAPGGSETILVVEDEPKLRASVVNVLSHLGYNVLEAADGASAIEAWKKHRAQILLARKVWNQPLDEIHLLLTDMVMPGGMTGKDLGEALLKENPGLKVIYVSGYNAEVAGKDFPLHEGVNFLTKPFQGQKLAQTIRNCLNGGPE
jgi:PAS domain S-box-containing protein